MKSYLFDSDVLIDFFNRRENAVKLIEELSESERSIISVISIAELRAGWNKKDSSIYLHRLYNIFETASVTKEIAEIAGEYREKYKTKGTRIPTMDSLIAATAKLYGYCLVTRNTKHFPMKDIDLYKLNENYPL